MNLTIGEVIEQIQIQRKPEQCFIKTWETGHTFTDIDLIDRFIAKGRQDKALEGFELLDMEQTWQELINLDPDNLNRIKGSSGEVIEWIWTSGDGIEKKTVYPFTPEGIMTIIDDEFFA